MSNQSHPQDDLHTSLSSANSLDIEFSLPPSDDSFTWSDERLLGFSPLDDIHEEFYTTTINLLTCDEHNLEAALEAFREHAIRHFGEEDEWMVSTDFPPRECHMDEHKAVLETVNQIQTLVTAGRATPALLHDFGVHLFEWFPGHAAHLDSALAAWMCKRTLGGKPVVFKRRLG